MKITAVYGSNRKGSTYHVARMCIDKIKSDHDTLTEFFLPRDMGAFCVGCASCFAKGESFCPHYEQVEPIRKAIEGADFVVFTTPVYVLRASAQMKALLDHLAFLFMTHRPSAGMFSKTALVVSTTAGGGTGAAMKDIATSLKFWGVAKIYKLGTAVYASEWDGVSEEKKKKIASKVDSMCKKLEKKIGHARPGLSTKALFGVFRQFHKRVRLCPPDMAHWQSSGWLEKQRPWK